MIANRQIRLAGKIDALAFNPGGDRAVVVLDANRLLLVEVSDRDLTPREMRALPDDRPPWATEVSFKETRVTFLDEETILVVRQLEYETSDRSIKGDERRRMLLQAVDAGTGAIRGTFGAGEFTMLGVDPLPVSPRHVLIGRYTKTLALIDTKTWTEVGRLRELDDVYDPIGDQAYCPEEGLTENGLAYLPGPRLLYVLWGYAFGSALQTYRFEPEAPRFVSIDRSPEFDQEPYTLCAKADGSAVAVLFSDECLGQNVDLSASGAYQLPRRTRLGPLLILSGGESRRLDVLSDTERDFLCSKRFALDPEGREVLTGVLIAVDGPGVDYKPRMFYLDDRWILLNSPRGLLLGIDTESGRTEVLQDLLVPIRGLAFHPGRRKVLAGCDDKTLTLLTV
ncbi:MAG: hypothetical protein P4L84_37055 [Isosphaeraceae bacterium]|nr:hypothetical protein [Isosphaeraceae bacterium]